LLTQPVLGFQPVRGFAVGFQHCINYGARISVYCKKRKFNIVINIFHVAKIFFKNRRRFFAEYDHGGERFKKMREDMNFETIEDVIGSMQSETKTAKQDKRRTLSKCPASSKT